MSLGHGASIVRSGLVMYLDAANVKSYPGSGTTWSDLTRNSNIGTLTGGPTFDTANGGSIVLDGTDDYVSISCAPSTIRAYNSTTQFIIKLPTYAGGQRNVVSYRTGVSSLYIGKQSGGIFCYYNTLNTQGFTVGSIPNNATVCVAITCDAANNLLSTYINGTLAGSATRTGWNTAYNTTMTIGGSDIEYMLGNYYSFSHYNKVLSAEEVRQNFEALRGRYNI